MGWQGTLLSLHHYQRLWFLFNVNSTMRLADQVLELRAWWTARDSVNRSAIHLKEMMKQKCFRLAIEILVLGVHWILLVFCFGVFWNCASAPRRMEPGCLKMSKPTMQQWKVGSKSICKILTSVNSFPLFALECCWIIIIRKWIFSILGSCGDFCNAVWVAMLF